MTHESEREAAVERVLDAVEAGAVRYTSGSIAGEIADNPIIATAIRAELDAAYEAGRASMPCEGSRVKENGMHQTCETLYGPHRPAVSLNAPIDNEAWYCPSCTARKEREGRPA